jgi:hypothetical protein
MSDIVYSQMTTPDGTILVSRRVHDFVSHQDKNGKEYFLDGGLDYVRGSDHGDENYFAVTLDNPHEIVRQYASWGTYGKSGKDPLRYVKVKDMETDHILAVLDLRVIPQLKTALLNELKFRGVDYD